MNIYIYIHNRYVTQYFNFLTVYLPCISYDYLFRRQPSGLGRRSWCPRLSEGFYQRNPPCLWEIFPCFLGDCFFFFGRNACFFEPNISWKDRNLNLAMTKISSAFCLRTSATCHFIDVDEGSTVISEPG